MAESQASCTAASTRSATVAAVSAGSVGAITLVSIVTSSSCPTPLTTARTAPLPAVPITSVFASSCCALIACCAAAKICCMSKPPGPIKESLLCAFPTRRRALGGGDLVAVFGDYLAAELALDQGHAGEVG